MGAALAMLRDAMSRSTRRIIALPATFRCPTLREHKSVEFRLRQMHGRSIKRTDLVPFKAVVEEMCMSRASIWRAARSNIPGFPSPVVIRRRVFWRRSDLAALEDALFQYPGRIAFEHRRDTSRKFAAMQRAKAGVEPKRARRTPTEGQRDLFAA
jgi:predicted DNA-binding transcriptional regulator AlpA